VISYKTFGESHSDEIGIEVRGMPKVEFDMEKVLAFMARRSANAPRHEPDVPEFSWEGDTMRVTIKNVDQRPQDYANVRTVPRPGHADYSSWITAGSIPTGGGKWSGRLTAPLCAAGAVALQELERRGITVSARVVECDGRKGGDIEMLKEVPGDDSCGAVVEVVAEGVPTGLGDAGEEGLESKFAKALFGISAVKGVEFGDGFRLASMRGSEANDPFIVKDGKVTLKTNRCGGILGGISIGMPIVARVAFKPTPSISREQDSVDLTTLKPVKLAIRGRHDKCVAFRGCPVVESAMALVILGEIS